MQVTDKSEENVVAEPVHAGLVEAFLAKSEKKGYPFGTCFLIFEAPSKNFDAEFDKIDAYDKAHPDAGTYGIICEVIKRGWRVFSYEGKGQRPTFFVLDKQRGLGAVGSKADNDQDFLNRVMYEILASNGNLLLHFCTPDITIRINTCGFGKGVSPVAKSFDTLDGKLNKLN